MRRDTGLRLRIEPSGAPPFDRECSGEVVTIGRAVTADIVVGDHSVSRQHARLVCEAGAWAVEDLGGRNGTSVNGERIEGKRILVPGDAVRVGGTLLRVLFEDGSPASPAATPAPFGAGSSIFRPVTELTEVGFTHGGAAQQAARLKTLNDFHRALAGPISLDGLLQLLLQRLFALLHPEEGLILLKQPDGTLATAASRRLTGAREPLVVPRSLISEVMDKGTAALVTDAGADERFAAAVSVVGAGIQSILAAPIIDASGCVGMIAVYSRARVRSFGEEDLELLVSLASAAALRIRNVGLAEDAAARRVLDRELALAHDIQMGMLPRRMPERPEVEMGAVLNPARAVGGDLYDFFVIGDVLWFVIADAAGKGVSAALYMAVTRTLFRAVATSEDTVSSLLSRMNVELARDNEGQFFVTALAGRIDLRTGELRYANAGHQPPLRASRSRAPEELHAAAGGIALGILEDAVYEEGRVPLAEGDVVLLYTDGVTEAINTQGELFSDARLYERFGASATEPVQAILAGIAGAVTTFAAGASQEDDITLLAIRYRGVTSNIVKPPIAGRGL